MIVIGTDTHRQSHTCGAVDAATGRLAGELTAPVRRPGFRELIDWGRSLDEERIWAIEDCRHVSGSFERFLIDRGERVVRVPPKLMGESRKGERARGKSDPIDAVAIARAALREGPETLHRLDRGGNRQLNRALHRVAVTQGRVHEPARAFLARKQAEGKSRIEALRCLKRHLTRTVWQALRASRDRESTNSLSLIDQVPKLRPVEGLALT